MQVLLIKLSSMGDIIHTLPALTDAKQAVSDLQITWVIEEGFKEIASWHPAVSKVIPISLRKGNYRQVLSAVCQMRAQRYDFVIDAQGLIKSAILARLARAKIRAGYDKKSIREAAASMLYNRKAVASWDLHAVERARRLFAQTLGYNVPSGVLNYGIPAEVISNIAASQQPYVVFLHGTTWESKHWPDEYWVQLADLLATKGLAVQVTWATPEQKARATMLAHRCANVTMLPHLKINQAAQVLQNARGVVAVDTGFAHLSAALERPLVAIFGATDISKNGVVGNNNINLSSKFGCAPCMRRTCSYTGERSVNPACLQEITPQLVWQSLSRLLGNTI